MPSRTSAARTSANLNDQVFDSNYPMHHDRRERWAKVHGYTLSHKHPGCIHLLAEQKHSSCSCEFGIVDHSEAWTRAGQLACVTAQPYVSGLSTSELERLQTQCQRLGLHLSVFRNQNWYAEVGMTLLLVIEL